MDTEEIKIQLKKKSVEYYKILCEKHNIINPPALLIDFSLTGQVAGYAYLKENGVSFNLKLCEENLEDFIKQVTGHEVSHLICFLYCKQRNLLKYYKSHGDIWKMIMVSINLNPDRCHNYKVISERIKKEFRYICPKCEEVYYLSTNLHNKINNGQKRICGFCKTEIEYFGENKINPIIYEE